MRNPIRLMVATMMSFAHLWRPRGQVAGPVIGYLGDAHEKPFEPVQHGGRQSGRQEGQAPAAWEGWTLSGGVQSVRHQGPPTSNHWSKSAPRSAGAKEGSMNPPTPTEVWRRLAYHNLALAFELSGHCHLNGIARKPLVFECLVEIKQASRETEEYFKTGSPPLWMTLKSTEIPHAG
jgi:hypothetical protein